jgi:alkylated DNA repair dioxygenase AlkB
MARSFRLPTTMTAQFDFFGSAGPRNDSALAEPRSAYLLSGAARTEWEHSIPPMDALRYSITFRNLCER